MKKFVIKDYAETIFYNDIVIEARDSESALNKFEKMSRKVMKDEFGINFIDTDIIATGFTIDELEENKK